MYRLSRILTQRRLLSSAISIVAIIVGVAGIAFGQSADVGWSIEIADAREAYETGDYELARRRCVAQLEKNERGPAADDAGALLAMILCRENSRSARNEGLSRLAEMVSTHRALRNRAEFHIARGIAHRGLAETSAALDELDLAISAAKRSGDVKRHIEAVVEMARTWQVHNEWESTPARLTPVAPAGATESAEARIRNISALRAELSTLKTSAAVIEVDLALAEVLLTRPETAQRGEALLDQLASTSPPSDASARAAMRLADIFESSARTKDAIEIYRLVARSNIRDSATRARDRLDALLQPKIELSCADQVARGAALNITLRSQSVAGILLEVRSAELSDWLASPKMRGVDAQLPESGSVHLSKDLAPANSHPGESWNSAEAGIEISCRPPPGAYVVIARGTTADGKPLVSKRLAVVSDLQAMCWFGGDEGVVWVPSRADGAISRPVQAKFWMRASFVATEVTFDGEIGRFRLPNESRVLRDRNWLLVTESGDELTIARGELLPNTGATPGAALFLVGPNEIDADAELRFSGVYFRDARASAEPGQLEVDVRDALDRSIGRKRVAWAENGVFADHLKIPAAVAGKTLRITLRRDGMVVSTWPERALVRVREMDEVALEPSIETAVHQPDTDSVVPVSVLARYSWGTPASNAQVSFLADGFHLPSSPSRAAVAPALGFQTKFALASDGREAGSFDPRGLDSADGNLGLALHAALTTGDGRTSSARRYAIFGPSREYARLRTSSDMPTAGEPLALILDWYAPASRAWTGKAVVEVSRDDRVIVSLPLLWVGRDCSTMPWTPPDAGDYVATLKSNSPEFATELRFSVGDPPSSSPIAGSTSTATASVAADKPDQVRFDGLIATGQRALAVVRSSRAIAAGAMSAGSATLTVLAAPDTQALIAVTSAGGIREFPVALAASIADAGKLDISLGESELRPGGEVAVQLSPEPNGSHTPLLVFLVRTDRIGTVDVSVPQDPQRASARDPRAALPNFFGIPDRLLSMLGGADVVWSGVVTAMSPTPLRVPLPRTPGQYTLMALSRASNGELSGRSTLIDLDPPIQLSLDVPRVLSAGDRTVIVAQLRNGADATLRGRVRVTAPGVAIAGRHATTGGTGAGTQSDADGWSTIDIAPNTTAFIAWDIEATAPGEHVASVEFRPDSESGALRDAKKFRVRASTVSAGAGAPLPRIRIDRQYEILDQNPRILRSNPGALKIHNHAHDEHAAERSAAGETSDDACPPESDSAKSADGATAISISTVLSPCTYLRVTESITIEGDLPVCSWVQALPPMAVPLRSQSSVLKKIGVSHPGPLDEIRYDVPARSAGRFVHQYDLWTLRPGAGVLPMPRVTVDGREIAVELSIPDERIIVGDR